MTENPDETEIHMKHTMTKRMGAVALTAGLVLGTGGVAVAYFTGDGSGTGHATTGTVTGQDFTLVGTAAGAPLFPGSGSQTVSFTAANGGSGSEYLGTVYLSVARDGTGNAIDPVTGPISGCSASWYVLSESSAVADLSVPGLTTTDSVPAGAVSMPGDSVDNQDRCQGHQIELDFTTVAPI